MTKKVLFVAAAGPRVGGGHVMRSLTLARELKARGVDCTFLATPQVAAILDVFAGAGIGRLGAAALDGPALAEATRIATETLGAHAVVFDHYGLAAPEHETGASGRAVMVIDDLADRPLGADLLVDVGQNRSESDYAGLTPRNAQLLLGPRYALVRREFGTAREGALTRRETAGPVRRVLVSLGLTDLGGITGRVVELALPLLGEAEIDVVLDEAASSFPELAGRRGEGIRLHSRVKDMAHLMAEADLSLGAGGATNWERCTLGLPGVVVVVAENQRTSAEALAAAGAALVVDARQSAFEAELRTNLAGLLRDSELRRDMAQAAATICDGHGTVRVAEACLALLS